MSRKAEFNPNPSPQWVKQVLAEDEADRWREAGRIPDGEAIDRYITELIERDDARIREQKYQPAPRADERDDPAAEMAKDVGAKFHRKPSSIETRPKPTPTYLTKRRAALRTRIRQVIMLRPGTRPRDQDFLFPHLAKPYVEEYLAWSTASGEYKDMLKDDRDRKFSRYAEDVADRSVGVLGRWRVGGA